MKQLVYVSTSTSFQSEDDLTIILHQCRHYNAINGVTGLLWADGSSFMQVLEGHRDSVDETYSRISADPRHRELVITHEAKIETREFNEWAMAYRWSFEDEAEYNERVRYLIRKAKGAARSNIAARIIIDTA